MKKNTNILYVCLLSLIFMASTACNSNVAFDKATAPIAVCEGENCNPDIVDPTEPAPVNGSSTEVFVQEAQKSKVDILFVVDNSMSMAVEQTELGEKFSSFISSLHGVDWQIAFTTTDVSTGRYGMRGELLGLNGQNDKKVLTAKIPNADQVFKKTVQRPETLNCSTCPSADEQPLRASILSMQKSQQQTASFYRADANVAIVVLSDEDEKSDGPISATQPSEVVEAFHALWKDTKKLAVYGIVIEPNDSTCLQEQRDASGTAYYGRHVAELAHITGGITGSLCQDDYSASLEKISEGVRQLVNHFELQNIPIEGSVKIDITPAQSIEWRVEGKKIIFSKPPMEGSKIQITYEFLKP